MQRVLVVNDDGYKAAGIRALIREFAFEYEVTAVAPDREQSWMSKSISGHHELHMAPVQYHEFNGFNVNGTPADCTQLGIYETDPRPNFIVSGINHGANIGHGHIMSSGTVGAAFEAAFQGIPAFAVSVWKVKHSYKNIDLTAPESVNIFSNAAKIAFKIIRKVMQEGFPQSAQVIVINIAYDATIDSPWAVVSPHTISYGRVFSRQKNGKYKNSGDSELIDDKGGTSDLSALVRGYVSILPISLQLTSEVGKTELARLLNIEILAEK